MVFFFKQKTAYEMRISDWSSDVCSSDLVEGDRGIGHAGVARGIRNGAQVRPVRRRGEVDRRGKGAGRRSACALLAWRRNNVPPGTGLRRATRVISRDGFDGAGICAAVERDVSELILGGIG